MSDNTVPHNTIALNLACALKNHLKGKGGKVLICGAKVQVSKTDSYHCSLIVNSHPR